MAMIKIKKIKNSTDLDKIWKEKIEEAFYVIFNKKTSSLKYQELYDVFRLIVISKLGDYIEKKIAKSFRNIIYPEIRRLVQVKNFNLDTFLTLADDYKNLIDKVNKIGVYYNSKYVISKRSYPTEYMGYLVFQEALKLQNFSKNLTFLILEEINKYREGDTSQIITIRRVLDIYVIMI